jgi:hypothetical protein
MKKLFLLVAMASAFFSADAAKVTVTMNTVSTTMSLVDKATGTPVEVGAATNKVYTFDAAPGVYTLTGYDTDGTTVNGSIDITVSDETEQSVTVLTCTAWATNSGWTVGTDYTIDISVCTREGATQTIAIGDSTTAGRKTWLVVNGNSYYATFEPSAARYNEGYMSLYRSATVTANATVSGAIPKGEDYMVTVPSNADFSMGIKFTHFTKFAEMAPISTETVGDTKRLTYRLAIGQVYNYRTWMAGGITQAGYFTMNSDATKRPTLQFSQSDYHKFEPSVINHDVQSNSGFETGDIFVNVNERGHLRMKVGEEFSAHAMRTWELTDNTINNYFIEPDFHYTIIGLDGKPSTDVIAIDNADTSTDPWSTIRAIGKGTAIVLVSYDAIDLAYYSGADRKEFIGGELWSAIWPENTGVYVVTVDQAESTVDPNMTINEAYNTGALKLSGKYVDAEHDVFYYLDSTDGYAYTFTPAGAAQVEIAYPAIGARMATYSGFGTEGVTANEDGSYTVLLREGRQIVRLTDAAGAATYQVLTAKKCHRDISNVSRPGSTIYQPGDKILVQYSGLHHPANKLAGIYNMSAYVTYNGTPNGTSLYLGSGQYTFGSAASAQAVTAVIPNSVTSFDMTDGVIQVVGFGDPIGNHRNISRTAGRSANFTAVSHKTYFGAIPDLHIPVTPVRYFNITVAADQPGVKFSLSRDGNVLTPNKNGTYTGTYGTYTLTAMLAGYRCSRTTHTIGDDADGDQHFAAVLVAAADAWDGVTATQPEIDGDVYQINEPAHLAWFAQNVNTNKAYTAKASINADIDLGDYEWTPIGGSTSSTAFMGSINGNHHTIKGLCITGSANYMALAGYANGATFSDLAVEGSVSGKQYAAGIVAYGNNVTVARCSSAVTVNASDKYAGGIVAYLSATTSTITDCYNTGDISAASQCGGISGYNFNGKITNVHNVGNISATSNVGGCVGYMGNAATLTNAYTTCEGTNKTGQTTVSDSQMASGEIAYRLGAAFGQHIGVDTYPVLGGMTVYYDENADTYSNSSYTSADDAVANDIDTPIYYDLQGRRIAQPGHGVTIVVHSDGTTSKIIAK